MEANISKNIIYSTQKPQEKVVLVAVSTPESGSKWSTEDSLTELAGLSESVGAGIVGKIVQKMKRPSTVHYLGKGKLEELLALKENLAYDTVIVDDEITPQQQHNLEEFLHSRVIDRIALILDIFARRARTHEGKLQVALAQYEYNLPRLTGKWTHLERLGAGIGTRGPGESQLETDKRIIRQKIARLKKDIEDVREHRYLYRQKRRRSGIPVVSLVGYTNTGKSSLLNALSRSDILAKNELFSTLDPTTRRMILPDKRPFLLTDTVGFIRKLPPALVTAFRATLEEIHEADLLVHVVDITSQNAAEQCETVEDILKDLGVFEKPRITVLNKIDVLQPPGGKWDEKKAMEYCIAQSGQPAPDTVLISAYRKWGFNALLEAIKEKLPFTTA
ncbi:MAG: GTPase HflX [Dehalococcoidales bacterium]|nr:GTPase HflX [Dehalococcoidales bacterium]